MTLCSNSKFFFASGVEITDFQTPDKTSGTIKYLPDILRIHQTSCLGSQVQMSLTCLPPKMYYGNSGDA